jgi:hypothetical protein
MAALAWVVAPRLAARLDGPAALARALLASLTVGLIWQSVLVLLLLHRERGALRWPVLKDALWLQYTRPYETLHGWVARLLTTSWLLPTFDDPPSNRSLVGVPLLSPHYRSYPG